MKITDTFIISPELRKHFKGYCSNPEAIMAFIFMKLRFSMNYRDLEEMASIVGCRLDHATITKMGSHIFILN